MAGLFERVLYPTDLSECATSATTYIKQLKRAGAKEVILLHVVDSREVESMLEGCAYMSAFVDSTVQVCMEDLTSEYEKKTNPRLEALKSELQEAGLKVEVRTPTGIPHEQILKAGKDADIIVMGYHGKGGLVEALLGSTAEKVIHSSTTPVLLVR
ncbi:MAG: universal stress protein [Methermicoccaceae archaeon]